MRNAVRDRGPDGGGAGRQNSHGKQLTCLQQVGEGYSLGGAASAPEARETSPRHVPRQEKLWHRGGERHPRPGSTDAKPAAEAVGCKMGQEIGGAGSMCASLGALKTTRAEEARSPRDRLRGNTRSLHLHAGDSQRPPTRAELTACDAPMPDCPVRRPSSGPSAGCPVLMISPASTASSNQPGHFLGGSMPHSLRFLAPGSDRGSGAPAQGADNADCARDPPLEASHPGLACARAFRCK